MTTLHASFEDDCSLRQQAGVAAIGLWRRKVEEFGEAAASETLRKSNLSVTTLSHAGGFTGGSGILFREALDDGYQAVFTASAVGARTLIVSPGGRGRYTTRHECRLVVQALRELSIVAEELGVQLAVMPRNSRLAGRWTSLHSLEDAVALCDATARRNVGVVYDSFYLAGPDRNLRTVEQCAERIFTLQLRDTLQPGGAEYNQCLPGAGLLPLEDTVQCLFENGFAGDIDVQVFSEQLWKQDPVEVIGSCQRNVSSLLKSSLVGVVSTSSI